MRFGLDSNTVVAEIDKLAGIIMTRSSSEKEEFMDVKIDPESFRKMEEIVKLLPGGEHTLHVSLFLTDLNEVTTIRSWPCRSVADENGCNWSCRPYCE